MADQEPIVFEILCSYSSEIVGEVIPVRAIAPSQSPSAFVSENAEGSLRQVSSREEISNIAMNSALNLLKISNGQQTTI
jgi:hypothetical protein